MAVSSSDIKLRVAIESASPDLSGVKQVENELVGMGQAAESAVSKVSAEAGTLADKLSKINAAGGFKDVAADALKAQAATDKLHTSVSAGFGRSNQVLQDMGRIIQDMPYGIMGIGNNIQPLVDSFGRAKAEAGGTGAAVKSVLAGLAGPAGLAMIGIPVVTSLAIAFGDKLVSAISAGGEKIDDFKERVAGISQYKNFTIEIEIAGMKKLDALDRKLDVIGTKLKMVKEEEEFEKRRAELKEQSLFGSRSLEFLKQVTLQPSSVVSGSSPANGVLTGYKQLEADEKARWQRYGRDLVAGYNTAETGKGNAAFVNYGDANNSRALKSLGYTDRQIVLFNEHLVILGEKAGVAKDKTAELTRERERTDKSGESEAREAASRHESWLEATRKADEALNRASGEFTLPTIAEATEKVADLSASLKVLRDRGDESALGLKRYNDAREQLTTAEEVQAKSVEDWRKVFDKATASLDKGSDSTLSYLDALGEKAAAYASLESELAMGDANRVAVEAAQKRYDKSLREVEKSTKAATAASIVMKEAFAGVGAVASLYGLNGTGVTGLLSGIDSLSSENINKLATEKYGGDTGKAQASVYAGLAQSLGQVVGGKAGSAISGAASGALAGSMIAPGIGTIIGGVIGLAGSLFGGDSAGKQARNDARRAGYNDILSSALSGGAYSSQLARGGGYTYDSMANWYTATGDRTGRLFNDRAEAGMAGLTAYVKVMDASLASVAALAKPSIVSTIAQIQTKYEYSVATVGRLAELEQARISDLTVALTGLSVDSLTSTFESVITSTSPEAAGKAMADKVMEGLAASIRQMQVATFMESVITPVLQPLYASLVENMVAGNGTAGDFSAINAALVQLTPTLTAFAQSLAAQGIAGNKAVDTTNALTDALGNFTASTSSFKTLLQQQYDNAKRIVDLQKSAYEDTVSKITSLRSSLDATLSSINGQTETLQTRRSAQADIAVAALLARTTGQLPLDGKLSDSLGVVAKPASSLYGSALDYARDMARTVADISALNDVAGTQLTDSQLQINWLEKISGTLDRSYDNSVTAYDQYVIAAKAQIDGLNGIGLSATVTNKSLADQTAAAQSALQEQVSGFSGMIGGIGAVETGVGSVENVMSTIELNQATYDAALKQVAGIYDVNASVVMVNSSIAALNQSISSSLTEKDAAAVATQAAAAQEVATAQAAQAQAESQASSIAQTSLFAATLTAMGGGVVGVYAGPRGMYVPNRAAYNRAVSKALEGNVSAQSFLKSTGYAYTDKVSVPAFALGGVHAGGARLVGEVGPELEITGPSRILSNRDTRSIFDVQSMLDALAKVQQEIADLRSDQIIGHSRIIINTRATANAVDLANNLAGVTG